MDFGESNAPLMEWTGLHDKNGKEIWEGDIVKWDHGVTEDDNGIGEVVFKGGRFKVRYCFCCHTEYEVIGNIYENPSLLGSDPTRLEK